MIELHRLGHAAQAFLLNPDLIVTIEAHPDTHISLSNGTKIVVVESPEEVRESVRAWRVLLLTGSFEERRTVRATHPSRRAAAGGQQHHLREVET